MCILGYYFHEGGCYQSPEGVEPKEGDTLGSLTLRDGYFRFSRDSTIIYPCPSEACAGGPVVLTDGCQKGSPRSGVQDP